ncbi:MAG: hypothetical protein [Microviridae sp.]|nr:MAG: hypothetical protein [Microviridae sp.]
MTTKRKETQTMAIEEAPKDNEQLIQREDVDGTPFIMITIKDETFGTLGNYKITESYYNKKQCENELRKMDWNNVVKVMTVVHEILTKK